MGLQARIAADAANLFLGADSGRLGSFMQTISRNPAGVTASAVSVSAIVDLDDEESAQGMQIEDERGRRITRHGRLELSTDVTVLVSEEGRNCDTFTIDGELWTALRVEGRDGIDGLQTVIIRRDEKVSTKKPNVIR